MIARATMLAALLTTADTGAQAIPEAETEHLKLLWREPADEQVVAALSAAAEELHARVTKVMQVGESGPVTVVFAGPSEQPDGRRMAPFVDAEGRVWLFRFTPDPANHLNALDHELVHALRIDRKDTADWFFEEGYAEFVALRANPSRAGFPWFGYPVTVVAGQWLASGEAIPMTLLRERHAALNAACTAQAYALRAAFFDWLGNQFGDDDVRAMAGERPAGVGEQYEAHFGAPFEQLVQRWEMDTLAQFESLPDASEQARDYRTQSPIRYQGVCREGTDF